MVEIAVLRLVRVQRVGGLVVGAVPREGEVDVLRNVAAQHGPEVVSHILGVVALAARNHTCRRVHRAAQHAGGLGVDDARHDVEIRFEEPDRQAVAQVRPQLPVTVEILGRRVEIGRIGLSVDGDVTGSLHQMLGRVIQRRVHREHPHEGPALFDVGVGVVEIHPVRVGRLQVRITVADVLGVRYVVNALQVGDRRAVGVGRDEEPQRVLAVDVQLAHHKIGHVVVGVLDLLGIVAHDLSVEGRTLVVDVGDERVALFRKTESGPHALRQVALS